ncbi:MAG: hypothetical protein KDJ43_02495, partial [Rhizobiaceae bacterium]|nr:hypothetical protein [Rhizobiaceae bacterium]
MFSFTSCDGRAGRFAGGQLHGQAQINVRPLAVDRGRSVGHVQARVRDTAAADGLRARLDLTLLDAEGCDRLRAIRPMIEAEAKLALSAFFERLQNTPEIASL